MKTLNDHTLEGLKLFPIFAWSILILFSIFVYTLTAELGRVTESIEAVNAQNAALSPATPSSTPVRRN